MSRGSIPAAMGLLLLGLLTALELLGLGALAFGALPQARLIEAAGGIVSAIAWALVAALLSRTASPRRSRRLFAIAALSSGLLACALFTAWVLEGIDLPLAADRALSAAPNVFGTSAAIGFAAGAATWTRIGPAWRISVWIAAALIATSYGVLLLPALPWGGAQLSDIAREGIAVLGAIASAIAGLTVVAGTAAALARPALEAPERPQQ